MTESTGAERITLDQRLRSIADDLASHGSAPTASVRVFLGWFGAYRRGHWIVRGIRNTLRRAGLVTVPDFESAYIDSQISFALAPQTAITIESPSTTLVADSVLVTELEPALVSIGIGDPTYRLGKLAAANNSPIFVNPDRPVTDAVTLMLSNDYSQLPVMTNERTLKGLISWRSIGARWALDQSGTSVRDFMDEALEISAERSLFSAIPTIVEHGYVLVRDATNRISGIITTADLSIQFQLLAEPFLLLGEIENHIRRLIDGRFTLDELCQARDPSDTSRKIESVADLTFGEYIRLLQEPGRWAKINLAIDRSLFLADLDAVRLVRNDVMHFDPDPIAGPDLATLRKFARFLQALQRFGV